MIMIQKCRQNRNYRSGFRPNQTK